MNSPFEGGLRGMFATFPPFRCLNSMKHLIMAFCLGLISFYGCKHKEEPRTMNIQIGSPAAGSQFDKDDTVWMTAFASSNLPLQVINLKLNKASNDSLVYFKQIRTGSISSFITEYFINEFNPHADLVMTVQTTDDDGNETGKKQVNFHCHAH